MPCLHAIFEKATPGCRELSKDRYAIKATQWQIWFKFIIGNINYLICMNTN